MNHGIVQDIYHSRGAYALLKTVGKNKSKLAGTPHIDFFQHIQSILSDHLIIHITKLFEKPSGRYDIISIPSMLNFIRENQADLELVSFPFACQQLRTLGMVDIDAWSIDKAQLSGAIIQYFQNGMPSLESSPALQSLRVIRDKRIAHRENIDMADLKTATFEQAFELIEFAQNFAIVVSAAYTSTLHGNVNEFFFSAKTQKEVLHLWRRFSMPW